jgi:YidC/Oxa1 family membrane protein insertase
MGLRHQEIKSLQASYQEKMRIAQMSKNQALFKQASYDYKMGMRKKGINYAVNFVNLLQIPILLSWFFSLRYMSNLPEVYPQMLTEGYLWFTDLSTYDPYFLLPVIAACASSLSISRSPNLARNNVMMPMLSQYTKYLKYLPFASLAFTGFFPASINLYWTTLALYQLMITQLMRTDYIVRKLGKRKGDNPFKNIQIDEAIFVEEKNSS